MRQVVAKATAPGCSGRRGLLPIACLQWRSTLAGPLRDERGRRKRCSLPLLMPLCAHCSFSVPLCAHCPFSCPCVPIALFPCPCVPIALFPCPFSTRIKGVQLDTSVLTVRSKICSTTQTRALLSRAAKTLHARCGRSRRLRSLTLSRDSLAQPTRMRK